MALAARNAPSVVDDEILIEALKEDEDNAEFVSGKSVDLVQVATECTSLRLSFKNVIQVDNLQGFEKLVRLCLDNNVIEEIANLDHLVHLEWLDLSFNNIRRIQGLSKLAKLKDLSLYNNQISEIEGLDGCTNLECVSLGNNRISSLDSVIKLRPFRVKMLTLAGNPVCEEAEYKMTILAFLDGIRYLDYTLVEDQEVNTAKEQYQDELLDIEEKESVEKEKQAREETQDKYMSELDTNGIAFAATLFDDMFTDDAELMKLKHLPGVPEAVEHFRNVFREMSEQFIEVGSEKGREKQQELVQFEEVLHKIRQDDDARSVSLIEEFNRKHKEYLKDVLNMPRRVVPSDMRDLEAILEALGEELMGIEVQQTEKFQQVMDEFEVRYNELKAASLELQQSFFRSVEGQEDKYFNDVKQLATDLIEKLAKDEINDEFLDDEAMNLVVDRDTCLAAVSGSHDVHVGRLLKKEDEARATETNRYNELLAKLRDEEQLRSRKRILEVYDLLETHRGGIADMLKRDADDDFDDEGDGA